MKITLNYHVTRKTIAGPSAQVAVPMVGYRQRAINERSPAHHARDSILLLASRKELEKKYFGRSKLWCCSDKVGKRCGNVSDSQ
jgi:hypothetical protein